jgi:hypothetical protein
MAKADLIKTGERITINCFTKINSNDIRIGRKIIGTPEKVKVEFKNR